MSMAFSLNRKRKGGGPSAFLSRVGGSLFATNAIDAERSISSPRREEEHRYWFSWRSVHADTQASLSTDQWKRFPSENGGESSAQRICF